MKSSLSADHGTRDGRTDLSLAGDLPYIDYSVDIEDSNAALRLKPNLSESVVAYENSDRNIVNFYDISTTTLAASSDASAESSLQLGPPTDGY